ncbi:MAG: GNAT family N-acetyltransferase [Arthrobacter sp.]|uniref:GNAT family N-acetyltransferase n=1 Tax=Arthrobacter sp. 179 TaxID=3457734 RepID=UPI002652F26D|nr:GNAT family N-acetyltransferase [Micrococcaceae bacterium]MDN6298925.1 GNAT family N-acetyltransferase [Micrococcaceae bacterium]
MTDAPATGPAARVLRDFAADDAAFVATLAGDPRVTRYVGNGEPWSPGYTGRRVRDALGGLPGGDPGAVRWFIGLEDGHRVGLFVSSRRGPAVEIGYWVHPGSWGRGIAGWMLGAALDPIRSVFGGRALLGRVLPGNEASIRVLESHGFRPEPAEGAELRFVRPAAASGP